MISRPALCFLFVTTIFSQTPADPHSNSSVFTDLGMAKIYAQEIVPGPAVEFGYRRVSGWLNWEVGLGLITGNKRFSADSGTYDSAHIFEQFFVSDPERFYNFFSAYHLALRVGPQFQLGNSDFHASVGLLPHFVSEIYADTLYLPSDQGDGKRIFIHEYYLDRYFGLGFDVKAGYRYQWSRWALGADAKYLWWVKYYGLTASLRLERLLAL